MNRKLHNSVTALFATCGLLVLSLMAANPVSKLQVGASDAVAAPTTVQAPTQVVVQARHAAEAEGRLNRAPLGPFARRPRARRQWPAARPWRHINTSKESIG
jgi:hypothetical protein